MNTINRWSFGVALAIVSMLCCPGAAQEQVFRGELAEGDKVHKDREAFIDYYAFKAQAGQLATVSMKRDNEDGDLDTYLYVSGPSGQEFTNDDDYEFGGSRIMFRVPESGEWEIGATGLGKDSKGAYTVKVLIQGLKPMLGERGDLDSSDEILLKDGELYDKFTINVEADKTYVALAASSEFDTYLSVHYPGGRAKNDDATGSFNMSLVVFQPTDSGEATIVMTSSSPDDEGRYRLAVYEAVAPTAAVAEP
jgi:hypothetical protein